MKRLAVLISVAALAAVGAGVGSASIATCVPVAVTPTTGHGFAAAVGQTAGCTGDSYHFSLSLVDVANGHVLAQRSGTTSGNRHGATNAAFCKGHTVRSVLRISIHGVLKTSLSPSVAC